MTIQEESKDQPFQERFELLIASGQANEQSVAATRVAVGMVEKYYGISLTEELGAFLVNHLAVTLKRLMDGEVLPALPEAAWGELRDYPEECAQAQAIATELERLVGIALSRDEVGFIAVHLFKIKADCGAAQKG
jgi:transcriptional regulatory protein LevR